MKKNAFLKGILILFLVTKRVSKLVKTSEDQSEKDKTIVAKSYVTELKKKTTYLNRDQILIFICQWTQIKMFWDKGSNYLTDNLKMTKMDTKEFMQVLLRLFLTIKSLRFILRWSNAKMMSSEMTKMKINWICHT